MTWYEDEAITIARSIARDAVARGLPPDAGAIGNLAQVVRAAHREGYDQAVREVASACELFIDTDRPERVPGHDHPDEDHP